MDSQLQLAIANDDVAELHRLIVEDRNLPDHASKDPFPNTPLHIAAAAGKTHVAMEIAILKPSFIRKLNPDGYSPMHLALQYEHYRIARALMTFDPELIRVHGQGGITPMHYIAGNEGDDELELLAEFLFACGSTVEDLTNRCETAVHIAVKNHDLKAFKVLFGRLKRVHLTTILNWKDEDGNNVLHIAVFEKQPKEQMLTGVENTWFKKHPERGDFDGINLFGSFYGREQKIIKLLIGYTNINAKNFQDKTALEIFKANPSGDQDVAKRLRRQGRQERRSTPSISLSQFFSMKITVVEKCACYFGIQDESLRNIVLLLSILIATITYQAALSPPGGCGKDSTSNVPTNSTVVTANYSGIAIGEPHETGNLILDGWRQFKYMAMNIVGFSFSIGTIWATAITAGPNSLIVYMSMAILESFTIGVPGSTKLLRRLLSAVWFNLVLAAFYLPWHMWLKHLRVLNQIDATRGPAGYFLQRKDQKIRNY